MPRGGARPGAGRKPGSKPLHVVEREMRTKGYQAQAEAAGVLPLDVMLDNMRRAYAAGDREGAQVCARDAAPYIHARLASSDVRLESDNTHRVVSDKPMTVDEWQAEFSAGHANDAVDGDAVAEPEQKKTGTT